KSYTGPPVRAPVRIGGSTYSREPFPKQVDELRESGFDYAELDLTWLTWEPTKLAAEAETLAKRLPLFTAHLPPSHFHQADLARGTRRPSRARAHARQPWRARRDRRRTLAFREGNDRSRTRCEGVEGPRIRRAGHARNLQRNPGRPARVPPQDATVDEGIV